MLKYNYTNSKSKIITLLKILYIKTYTHNKLIKSIHYIYSSII